MTLVIDNDRKEVIRVFMGEAKKNITGLNSGLNDDYKSAIGLVNVAIAFECFTNVLDITEPDGRVKRRLFNTRYGHLFTEHFNEYKDNLLTLKRELDIEKLKDMTPRTTRRPIDISSINDFEEVTEVFYRVRCNLVHGNKAVNSERNKLLIKNSSFFLYTLLDQVLRSEEIIE